MQIKGTEGFRPIDASSPRIGGVSAAARIQPQNACYDHFSVSSPAAQDRSSFKELVANLSYQVRTCNTTGKIQELRRQVSAGEYQIEPRETAARMLLLGEDPE